MSDTEYMEMMALAVTGTQVVVAGPLLLRGLKMPVKKLSRCTEVRVVNNSHVKYLGKCILKMEAFRSADVYLNENTLPF